MTAHTKTPVRKQSSRKKAANPRFDIQSTLHAFPILIPHLIAHFERRVKSVDFSRTRRKSGARVIDICIRFFPHDFFFELSAPERIYLVSRTKLSAEPGPYWIRSCFHLRSATLGAVRCTDPMCASATSQYWKIKVGGCGSRVVIWEKWKDFQRYNWWFFLQFNIDLNVHN